MYKYMYILHIVKHLLQVCFRALAITPVTLISFRRSIANQGLKVERLMKVFSNKCIFLWFMIVD